MSDLYTQYVPKALGLINPFPITSTNMPFVEDGDKYFGNEPIFVTTHEGALMDYGCTTIPGIGFLPAGLIMARITAGTEMTNGKIMPFDFCAKVTSVATKVLTMEDKNFVKLVSVGDELAFATSAPVDSTATSMGKVTAKDESAGTITITTAGAVAADSYVSFVNSGPLCIIDQSVETGAYGAQTSVIYSNAVLWKNRIHNLTDAAVTALGAKVAGLKLIVK